MTRWAPLRGEKRNDVLNEALVYIDGIGGSFAGDYIAMFHRSHGDYRFYIVKYGCRTIYERVWDEEWYDVYNWNAVLLVEKPDGSMEPVDTVIFLDYNSINKVIERWFEEYPEKYFISAVEDDYEFEFPDWAKFIVSQALLEVNSDNIDKVKSRLASTALCVEHRLLKQAYKLLELKVSGDL